MKLTILVFDYDFNSFNVQLINLIHGYIKKGVNAVQIMIDKAEVGMDYSELLVEFPQINFEFVNVGFKRRRILEILKHKIPTKSFIERIYFNLFFNKQKIISERLFHFKPDRIVLVERKALIAFPWNKIKNLNAHVIYYSMELYYDSHPHFYNNRYNIWLNYFVRKSVNKINLLLIQSKSRERIFRDEYLYSGKVFHLPVSVRNYKVPGGRSMLHEYFDLPQEKKILLQFGTINKFRMSDLLVEAISKIPDDMVVVMHGYIDPQLQKKYQVYREKLKFTGFHLPNRMLPELVRSAYAGICTYRCDNENDRYAVYSSDKIARFLKEGIPIIVSDEIEYRNFVKDNRVGVVTKNFSDFDYILDSLKSNYVEFKDNALNAYLKYYNFDSAFSSIEIEL